MLNALADPVTQLQRDRDEARAIARWLAAAGRGSIQTRACAELVGPANVAQAELRLFDALDAFDALPWAKGAR